MNMEKPIFLAFLSLEETKEKDGYIGAILITDAQGVPLEFRCTHPVKPTLIQKPLYGDSLQPFIGNELCGKPLYESIQNKPSCIFVNSDFLLDLRIAVSVPVIFVRKAGEAIKVESIKGMTKSLPRQRLESPSGKFQPVIIMCNPDYKDDFDKLQSLLGDRLKNLDPLEPFNRITKAVEVLAQQDKRFQ